MNTIEMSLLSGAESRLFALKFLKFGVVGFSGIFLDFGLTWLAKERFSVGKYYANAIGFLAAASSNFYLNRVWTFESHDPAILLQFSKFLVISTIGLGLNTLLLFQLHERWNWSFYFSKIFAIGLVVVWNFLANYFFTF